MSKSKIEDRLRDKMRGRDEPVMDSDELERYRRSDEVERGLILYEFQKRHGVYPAKTGKYSRPHLEV